MDFSPCTLLLRSGIAVAFLWPAAIQGQGAVGGTAPHLTPVSIAPIAARQVQVGDSLRIPVVVDDAPPGVTIQLRLDGAPATAKLEGSTIRWRPARGDAGAQYDMVVRAVSDGQELARSAASVHVADAHRPPVIRQPADRVLPPGDSLSMLLEASDPDGDALSVAVTNVTDRSLPPRYDVRTGLITWQAPAGSANRVYLWHIVVSDGDGGSATSEMHVSVRSLNVAPVCGPMRTYKRDEGERVELALDADDANGDSLSYQPLATLPNATLRGASYDWTIPYGFVLPTRQDSTVRFEWRATDPSRATTAVPCVALVTVFRSMAEGPFRVRQAQHRQLVADVRTEFDNYQVRERATRDSLAGLAGRRRGVKRAALVSAVVGGLLQIAKSEDTRRIAAGISATLTVGLSGFESTLEDSAPLANRAEVLGQQRAALQRALSRFLRKYGEGVSKESLLGATYDADHLELFDLLAATGRVGGTPVGGPVVPPPPAP